MTRKRLVRVLLTLAVTGGCLGYILWQLNVRRTVHILVHSNLGWFFGALLVMLGGVPPMAFRWRKLLEARGIRERLAWRGSDGGKLPANDFDLRVEGGGVTHRYR